MLQRVCNKINKLYSTQSSEVPPTTDIPKLHKMLNYILFKGDSAATSHYIRPQDKACLQQIKPHVGPPVTLPDADQIKPSHQGSLNLNDKLSKEAKLGTILPPNQLSWPP